MSNESIIRQSLSLNKAPTKDINQLLILAEMLTKTRPDTYWRGTGNLPGVKGAWQINEGVHGPQPHELGAQAIRALIVLKKLRASTRYVPINITVDSMAKLATYWRTPAAVNQDLDQTEYDRWLRKAQSVKASKPMWFDEISEPDIMDLGVTPIPEDKPIATFAVSTIAGIIAAVVGGYIVWRWIR